MGRYLGIDFGPILIDFWSQVGTLLVPKIDPKGERNRDIFLNLSQTGVHRLMGEVPRSVTPPKDTINGVPWTPGLESSTRREQ